jgi:hypothetical protein
MRCDEVTITRFAEIERSMIRTRAGARLKRANGHLAILRNQFCAVSRGLPIPNQLFLRCFASRFQKGLLNPTELHRPLATQSGNTPSETY